MFVVKRSEENPILSPSRDRYWEEFATFNPCPVKRGKKVRLLYRAISAPDALQNPRQRSIIGIGESEDGVHFTNRRPFIEPEEEWEKFGCEDPRATFFEGKYYIFYTALSRYPFGPEGIKVAVAVSRDLKKIYERHLVTPFDVETKAMTLFPERIGGKIVVVFSFHTNSPPAKTVFAFLDKVEDLWSKKFWEKWRKGVDNFNLDLGRAPYDHVEIGAPPLKTKDGWLLIYSHIQNYFSGGPGRIFGIEAVLLDKKNPRRVIGRTRGPILAPEEPYELIGATPSIVFPSGALIQGRTLSIYYGAADTTGCVARLDLPDLLASMHFGRRERYGFKRFAGNPVITSRAENAFESRATFNPAAILSGGRTHILYRAMSDDNTSTIGYAASRTGESITERLSYPVYVPREDFEKKRGGERGNSGCEDPRLIKIGKRIYLCYTAYDGASPPRVAISSILEKDFLRRDFRWEKPFLLTPAGVDNKDACLFPVKFKSGYFVMHRVGNEICGDYLNSLDFSSETVKRCFRIIGPRENMWDSAKVGTCAPPIHTKHGWLLLYHGVSKSHNTYRVGAILLDLKDPTIVLSRSTDPILEPEEAYEHSGVVSNVVFPCGMTVRLARGKKMVYIYYGGGDKVVGVAKMELGVLLGALVRGMKLKT